MCLQAEARLAGVRREAILNEKGIFEAKQEVPLEHNIDVSHRIDL